MTLITRRNALKLGLAGAATWRRRGPASALVEIVVTGGNFTPLPIAIPDFASSDPAFGARDRRDRAHQPPPLGPLRAARSGEPAAARRRRARTQPDFAAWRGINVDALVMGQVERGGADRSPRCASGTRSRRRRSSASPTAPIRRAARRIAHIVSDAIYESLAGETGYFDTRVVYVAESGPKANRTKRLAIMDQDGANVQYITDRASRWR